MAAPRPLTGDAPAPRAADAITHAFDAYQAKFRHVTRRARRHFERRDWRGMRLDARERLGLYGRIIGQTLPGLRDLLGPHLRDPQVWIAMRDLYADNIARRIDFELAETFYNSVTRRIFTTVGVDPRREFVDATFGRVPAPSGRVFTTHYVRGAVGPEVVAAILETTGFTVPFRDLPGDAGRVSARIGARLREFPGFGPPVTIDVLDAVFHRGKGAYLVARLGDGRGRLGLVLALVHDDDGVTVDAVLMGVAEVSVVFSFTHSYFHADIESAHAAVYFLRSVLPAKPVGELYSALGYSKHGKTELYRDLRRHLRSTTERFEMAPGARGAVMAVFAMPSYEVVFKVIRDAFPPPKCTTRRQVREKYDLVFMHDRAGRLTEALEFEHLTFARDRFDDDVLADLLDTAGRTVSLAGNRVHIRHLYTERKVTPLDVYLRQVAPEQARAAIVEYGRAIADLAATNIFAGDLLLKNFGVTRNRRVVFYDYDEISLLSACRFRRMPPPRDGHDDMADDPWFSVGRDDVFPEEFLRFLGLRDDLRAVFLERHGPLLDPSFWTDLQQHHRAGRVIDIFPYGAQHRLGTDPAS